MTEPLISTKDILPAIISIPPESSGFKQAVKNSILRYGIFYPIIVEERATQLIILDGRTRLCIFRELGMPVIPTVVIKYPEDQVSYLRSKLIGSVPWYDQVEYERQLHECKIRELGIRTPGRPWSRSRKPGWSQVDTARSLGVSFSKLCVDLKLAEEIIKYPELRRICDKGIVIKMLKKLKESS